MKDYLKTIEKDIDHYNMLITKLWYVLFALSSSLIIIILYIDIF
jgi:hypothetical protein